MVFSFGCDTENRNAWTIKDSWYHEPDETGLTPWDWNEIKYYEIKPNLQNEAQAILKDSQIIEISNKELIYFSDQPIQISGSKKMYLVRGVFLNEGTGSFSIYSKGNQLWVYHGSLGHNPVPMKRKALVIALNQKPVEIFITCMMDE